MPDDGEPTTEMYLESGNALERTRELSIEGRRKNQDAALVSGLRDGPRPRRIDTWYKKYDKYGDVARRRRLQQLSGMGDVLSTTFVDAPVSNGTSSLSSALQLEDPHMVLKALVNMIHHDGKEYTSDMLEKIPPNTFSEILRLLDPANFIDRFVTLHKEIGPATVQYLRLPPNEHGYLRFCNTFLKQMNKILEVRSQKHPLSTSDMRFLLKCARAVGSAESAHAIWRSMTSISQKDPEKRIRPDAECYNHYLASKTWNDSYNSDRRYKLRVIPSNLSLRSWKVPPHGFQGHRIGPDGGIKAEVSEIFRQMVESGISGDEETFCLMMVAMAREGDVTGVAGILQRVWGVEVDSILSKPESEVNPPKFYLPQSPFSPSKQLLFTIAHVYGINNEIPTALRLVDFVSRQYNVTIPLDVWNELLQWTYVASVRRTGRNPETNNEDLRTGQLGAEAVTSLWDTMTMEPYNVEPTLEMYNRLITSLIRRGRFGEAKVRMEEAYQANHKYIHQLSRDVTAYRSSHPSSPTHAECARNVSLSRLRVQRNRLYIRRWVKLFIRLGSSRLRFNETFCTEELPDFLKQWERFVPVRVQYLVATGKVAFSTGVREANFRMQLSFADGARRPNLLSKHLILPSSLRKARGSRGQLIFRRRTRSRGQLPEDSE